MPRKCSLFSFSSPICCRRESFSPSHCSVKVSFLISATAPAITSAGVDVKIPLKVADAAALSTVNGEVVATEEAGTYVLKPFRSPKSKKLKTAVVFVPRLSHFDIENEQSNKNEFRVRPHHFLYTCHIDSGLTAITRIGVFHALLDFDLLVDGPHVRSKHRNTGRTAQSAICNDVLERRPHLGAQ